MDERFWIEIAISALIALAATFFGVYLAFWKERRRVEAAENDQFGQIVRSMVNESANNEVMLNEIMSRARASTTIVHEIFSDTLQVALRSPLFYQKAEHSLILAAQLVMTQTGKLNNALSLYRLAAAGGREMTDLDAKGVQIRAETLKEFIGVLQELLGEAWIMATPTVVADPRSEEVKQRLAVIYGKEREQLERAGLWWGRGGDQDVPA